MKPAEAQFSTAATSASERAQRILTDFARTGPTVLSAVLASEDGMELAAHPASNGAAARLAAMTSSLHALAEALVREAGLSSGRALIAETEDGVVVVLQVPGTTPRISLAVVARGAGILGHLLWSSRNCCTALAPHLSRSS